MKKVLLMCLILLVGNATFALAYESIVQGSHSNINLIINETPIYKSDLYSPLINVDGSTYMSVRDFGRYSNMDVLWNETNNKITMQSNNSISIKSDTALAIGKALIQDIYKEQLTDSTKYMIIESIANRIEAKPYFTIYACFNPQEEIDNDINKMYSVADVRIRFHDYLSDIEIEEMN